MLLNEYKGIEFLFSALVIRTDNAGYYRVGDKMVVNLVDSINFFRWKKITGIDP